MSQQSVQVSTTISKSPAEVIAFIADVRNRASYQQALKSVTNIQGEPGQVGTTWNWKWDAFGHELEGTGRCTEYEAGKRYAFVTAGGIVSQFTYDAQAAGDGTKLTIEVQFEIPAPLAQGKDPGELLAAAQQKGEEAVARLKAELEK